MAQTTLPADRLKSACEKAASRKQAFGGSDIDTILRILHLSSAALSVNANASLSVTSDEFMLLAECW